ncbi:MAG: zf-HC2 domain-containing protein [Acidobacteria bacterium]|nr:zf-HC2 domain-containing protein [Acidobacteriota bacterium]
MMHAVSCEAVQDRLEEFHDDELTLEERVAIQGHLRDCVTCALVATELEEVRASLRDMALALPDRTAPEADRLSRRVVERVRVEAQFSWRAEVRALFQDMHLVWAALGATAATLVCLAGSVSVLHAASQERPDSLAGLITFLANPGSNENPVRLDSRMLAPRSRTDAETFAPLPADDAVLALSAVVTREGRVQNLELLRSNYALDVKVRPDVLLAMLDAAARMEFEPAQAGGAPVAVSMVWVLASTTVKGSSSDDVVLIRRRVDSVGPVEGPVPPKTVTPAPVVARPTTDDMSAI